MSLKIKVQQIKRSLVIFIAIYTLNSKNICISDHNVNVNCQNHLIMNGTFPWMKSEPDCHVTNYPDSFLHVSWSFLINIYSWEKIYTVLIDKKGRHCCSVGELKITFASTCNHGCKESVFNVLFNVLFLVLDFPLGAPNTLLKHVIERSIWRIVVGEGSWWGWGFSQDWWLGFWSC